MRLLASFASFALTLVALASSSRRASAEEERPALPWTLGIAPLPLLYSTASVSIERSIASDARVSLIIDPQVTAFSETLDDGTGGGRHAYTLSGAGIESGLRWYWSAPRVGSCASFVDGGFLLGKYDADGQSFARFGAAADIGERCVFGAGFSALFGGGLQYAVNGSGASLDGGASGPFPTAREVVFGSGPRPRLLASIGWSF